jgi:hypothetical protein
VLCCNVLLLVCAYTLYVHVLLYRSATNSKTCVPSALQAQRFKYVQHCVAKHAVTLLTYLISHSEPLELFFDPDRGPQTELLTMCCDLKTNDSLQPAAVRIVVIIAISV